MDELEKELSKFIDTFGVNRVRNVLDGIVDKKENQASVLTIVANEGVHYLPEHLKRGDVYSLSRGSLDFSSESAIKEEFELCLSGLAKKLKSQNWDSIYLVPFGPTVLSALAKLLVYRVTGLETVDVMHVGGGAYVDIGIDLRSLILSITSKEN